MVEKKVEKLTGTIVQFKCTNDPNEQPTMIDFSKRNKTSNIQGYPLQPLYAEPIKLSFEKYKDM